VSLIIYGFTSRSRIFHLYGDGTIADEGLQNLGLCSALRAFQQREIFIVLHLLQHGASIYTRSHPMDRPIYSRLLRHTRGCEGSILTRILTGPHSVASYDTPGVCWGPILIPDDIVIILLLQCLDKQTGHKFRHNMCLLQAIFCSPLLNSFYYMYFKKKMVRTLILYGDTDPTKEIGKPCN
jgi:hypothetical protein